MATDYFMKIDGVAGDTTDAKYPNQIKVVSWSWGETLAITLGSGGTPTTRPDLQDLQFTARTSAASPVLFQNCASGVVHKSAELAAVRTGANPVEYLKVTLTDVLISSYQVAGNEADNVPLDQVSLYFNKIQVAFTPQRPDGGPGTPITRGWDKRNGVKF